MLKQLKYLLKKISSNSNNIQNEKEKDNPKVPLNKSLKTNINLIQNRLGNSIDLIIHPITLPIENIDGCLIFFDTLVDKNFISEKILKDMFSQLPLFWEEELSDASILDFVNKSSLSAPQIQETSYLEDCIKDLLNGKTLIFLENFNKSLSIETQGYKSRNVTEPQTEAVVRGPMEGFTEDIQTNLGLLRKRLRSASLRIETKEIGEQTRTRVSLCFLEDLAIESVVEEVRKRLDDIKVDAILESGYIEEFIEDNPYSPFPQLEHTERPDKVSAAILEGRIAVFTDGTPFVLLAPTTFFQFLQSSEDYYERYVFSTLIRWLRVVAFNIAFLLPAIYISATTIHHEMIPTKLALSIAGARTGVPFPALLEAFLMEATFELLREAGIRLPKTIGPAISIVGALVIGQAAVEAGLVSPIMVIVVSVTAISSFSVPAYNMAISLRMLRFPMMIAASILGLPGVVIGMMVILMHLVSLRSFGVPYLSPIAPFSFGDLKDIFIRVPWWAMFLRPRLIGYKNPQRQGTNLMPKHSKKQTKNRYKNYLEGETDE